MGHRPEEPETAELGYRRPAERSIARLVDWKVLAPVLLHPDRLRAQDFTRRPGWAMRTGPGEPMQVLGGPEHHRLRPTGRRSGVMWFSAPSSRSTRSAGPSS